MGPGRKPHDRGGATPAILVLLLLGAATLAVPASFTIPADQPAAEVAPPDEYLPAVADLLAAPAAPGAEAAFPLVRGDPATGLVGLTFDAGGSDSGQTGLVLDTLREHGIQATFFLTGEWAQANPGLVQRMVAEGHELANHTYSHPNLTHLGDEEALGQVQAAEDALLQAAGVLPLAYVRPPFGAWNRQLLALLSAHGYQLVYWTLDSRDWQPQVSVRQVVERVGRTARPGDVVIFHCYPAKTAQALPGVLAAWEARGLRAGSLSAVLGR